MDKTIAGFNTLVSFVSRGVHPWCTKCNKPVEKVDLDYEIENEPIWHVDRMIGYKGNGIFLTMTLRCHGEEWSMTRYYTGTDDPGVTVSESRTAQP